MEALDSLKRVWRSAMECADVATFTFATWEIRSCPLCKFISPGAMRFIFPSIFRGFRQKNRTVELFNWSEMKWNICKLSEGRVKTCKDYVIGRETTTIPKIVVDVAAFTYAAWHKIRLCLLCKFITPEETVVSSFAILRGFLTDLCDWSEFFGCLIEVSQIQRKINYLLR